MMIKKDYKYSKFIFTCFTLSIVIITDIFALAEPSASDLQKQIWKGLCSDNCDTEKKQLENKLQTNQIIQIKDISNRNVPYPKKVIFDSGMKAMLKIEESYFPIQKSEFLAYQLDQLFQFNLVPTTVLRNIDGKLSSLQLFVDGLEEAFSRGMNRDETPQEVLVFDFLTYNFDRHSKNWMYVTESDHPIAIDNDQSFGLYVLDELRSQFPERITPLITEAQYKKLCQIRPHDIRQIVYSIFESRIALKVSEGIISSHEKLIRMFEKNGSIPNSCL